MPISTDVLAAARKRRAGALTEVLRAHYASVYRMARGLCGDEAAARAVVQFVLSRAPNVVAKWKDETAPDRWFYHHTLLAARRQITHKGSGDDDLLLLSDGRRDPPFVAFTRALRSLPPQQREAFVLHHGEHLNARFLGVSMDCSVQAAETHLAAATQTLQAVAGPDYTALVGRFTQAYANLTPPAEAAPPASRAIVNRHLLPRRIYRAIRLTLLLAVIIALTVLALRYRNYLESFMPQSR